LNGPLNYFAAMTSQIFMRCCAFVLFAVLAPALAPSRAEAQQHPPTVIELFTSQGCNSCPPADRLLGKLSQRDDVLALTFNVDYWDYLGWKDTLASPANTERQQNYARALSSRRMYTPQMVIGGHLDAIGSDVPGVKRAIDQDRDRNDPKLDVHFTAKDNMTLVQIIGAAYANKATIWLVRYSREVAVKIRRGENAGNELTYHNVVKDYKSLGLWRGHAMEIALDTKALGDGADACAIIVQLDGHGPIVGAKRMKLTAGG
jgi:hypothetical protein